MEEGLVVRGRVAIDTRQPFKSVKETVMLFGEKVLASEVYAHKLKEMGGEERENNQHGTQVAIEEEKQTLGHSKNESNLMAYYLMSIKQQLEETKSELNQLKSTRGTQYMPNIDPEIEEIKCIENPKTSQAKLPIEYKHESNGDKMFEVKQEDSVEFRIPSPTKVIVEVPKLQERSPSSFKIKKAKKKYLVPLLSGIFSKSKG